MGDTSQDVSPRSIPPPHDTPAKQSEGSIRYSAPIPNGQQPSVLAVDTGSAAATHAVGSSLRHELPRDSAEYSPTSTPRDAHLSVNIGRSQLRDSADYSPTAVSRHPLNFSGGPPMASQDVIHPIPPYAHHGIPAERHIYNEDLPGNVQGAAAAQRPRVANHEMEISYEPSQQLGSNRFANHVASEQNIPPYNNYTREADDEFTNRTRHAPEDYNHDRGLMPQSASGYRPTSSIYEGDNLLTANQFADGNMPEDTKGTTLASTPQTDDEMTSGTEDRDEMTTTTEARTSIDTTIPANELHNSQFMSDKEADLLGAGDVKSGKWDGTVPVANGVWPVINDTVADVRGMYSPSKYTSAFSEHFED